MEERVKKLLLRLSEVESLLSDPEIFADQKKYKDLNQEYSYLAKLREAWNEYSDLLSKLKANEELAAAEKDPELTDMIQEEKRELSEKLLVSQGMLETLLVPPDPKDSRDFIIELRAGTGGDEAAIFVGDCARMYTNYINKKGWKAEIISCAPSELGGFREYIFGVSGVNAHRFLQYEGGTHRVQRVPETETQGRLHTSAITVAVLLEPDGEDKVDIDERDLRIDTYRSSGAGGQHVNKTDSAVRITHIPTNTVVACQEERSQHKNREKAMRLLVAKIAEKKAEMREAEVSKVRSSQVGSGDRSERIRTYNFPQNRITDHRIPITIYSLDRVMDGDMDCLTEPLVAFFYNQKLTSDKDEAAR